MADAHSLHRQLYVLTEVAKALTLPLELPELLNAVIQKIIGVIEPAERGTVLLWDEPAGLLRPAAASGYDFPMLNNLALRSGEAIAGKAFQDSIGYLLCSLPEVTGGMANLRPANRSILAKSLGKDCLPICSVAEPIRSGDNLFGVLVLDTYRGPETFSTADLPFLRTISDLIALAIDRDRLSAQAVRIREERRLEFMRSEVLATLSHELRMPLTAIQGYSSALLLEDVNWSEEKRKKFLHLIEEESQTMQSMLEDILDSSMINVDQFAIEKQPARLSQLASSIAEEIQVRNESHRIMVDFPEKFPPIEVDPRWIKQVFRNILDNAVKYSPQGGLIVIRAEERLKDVVVMIADQGIGISPEDMIPLFERYFRVRSPVNLHIPGVGLGLPISRAIIEGHGGRIWAESKPGEGTTISFSLPKG